MHLCHNVTDIDQHQSVKFKASQRIKKNCIIEET